MNELPETWRQILRAVIAAPLAWQSPEAIAAALGWEVDATTDILADLDAAGWLSIWERDDGLTVTLSTLSAERLRVRLVEVGAALTPRWWSIGDPEPTAPKARHVCADDRAATLEFAVDPAPTPEEALAAAEVAAHGRGAKLPPRPTLLIGQGLTPWPGPAADNPAPCPACRDEPLDATAYCLRCDRWGLDDRERPERTARPTSLAALAAGVNATERRAAARLKSALDRRKQRRRHRLGTQGMAAKLNPDAAPASPRAKSSPEAWPAGSPVRASARPSPGSARCNTRSSPRS